MTREDVHNANALQTRSGQESGSLRAADGPLRMDVGEGKAFRSRPFELNCLRPTIVDAMVTVAKSSAVITITFG